MTEDQVHDYTEYISRQGRGKLVNLLYDVAVENVKQERSALLDRERRNGRPRGDAYKLASEWLGMSKTNFYNLTQGRYATSNATVKRLIDRCSKARPEETYNLLRKDLVESQRQLENMIDRLAGTFSSIVKIENRSFPRRIQAP